jgi:oxygen-independent coproporphyrinogen-3 oxidase
MAEITMEANPEDLTKEKLKQFRTTPVNRFSIGVQSFFQNDLDFMNRIHSAEKSIDAIKRTQDAGFQNITIDLIYGTPTLTNENWKKNLEIAFDLRVKHISAYCLTVEEKTALHHFITSGKIKKLDEEKSAEQFELLQKMMLSNHFVQYEISNFCTENYFSKHNSNYWKQIPYIGLGPSAHSFDGASRQWNVRNNAKYIELVEQKKEYFEKEQLTEVQLYNEFIMTGLRTMWGLDLKQLEIKFGRNKRMFCVNSAKSFIEKDWIKEVSEHYILSDEGKLFADKIASDLFYTEN